MILKNFIYSLENIWKKLELLVYIIIKLIKGNYKKNLIKINNKLFKTLFENQICKIKFFIIIKNKMLIF